MGLEVFFWIGVLYGIIVGIPAVILQNFAYEVILLIYIFLIIKLFKKRREKRLKKLDGNKI